MAGATWNCCRLGASCVPHTIMHHTTSCKATYVFSRNRPPALSTEWPGSLTCYCCCALYRFRSSLELSTDACTVLRSPEYWIVSIHCRTRMLHQSRRRVDGPFRRHLQPLPSSVNHAPLTPSSPFTLRCCKGFDRNCPRQGSTQKHCDAGHHEAMASRAAEAETIVAMQQRRVTAKMTCDQCCGRPFFLIFFF